MLVKRFLILILGIVFIFGLITVIESSHAFDGGPETVELEEPLPPAAESIVADTAVHEIQLNAGWNMISSYLIPDDPLLDNMLAGIANELVLVKDDNGGVYWPDQGVDSLSQWDVNESYQVYMSEAATLSIIGTYVDPAASPQVLTQGWSMIAYHLDVPIPMSDALDSISSQLILAKDGDGRIYWPGYNVDQTGSMQPGKGYQLYLSGPGTLTYPTINIHINEVMFSPNTNAHDWVELKNSGAATIDISGFGLTDEDGNWYEFPDALPPLLPGAFVLVIFDGVGNESNDYDLNDNLAILHTPSELINIFEDETDQVALYNNVPDALDLNGASLYAAPAKPSPFSRYAAANGIKILSFVAWGSSPGEDAVNAAMAGIWFEDWAVNLSRGFGISTGALAPDESIGLLPGSVTNYPNDWELFQAAEVTMGTENTIPSISSYTLEDGAGISGATFGVGWNPVTGATGYRFQLDDNIDFNSPQVDIVVVEPRYIDPGIVPDGVYYWRVSVEQINGQSVWSDPISIEVFSLAEAVNESEGHPFQVEMGESKVLGINWQLQHKDTRMLDMDGSPELGRDRWDSAHEEDADWIVGNSNPVTVNNLDNMYCVRASTSMVASYYGGNLSQDRISYEFYKDVSQGPRGDLGHGTGPVESEVINWLDWALGDPSAVTYVSGKPAFSLIQQWIDEDRPIVIVNYWPSGGGHVRVIDGYNNGLIRDFVHVLDPAVRAQDILYSKLDIAAVWVGPAGINGAPNVRSDEDEDADNIVDTIDDSDDDGIVDFDERYRFAGLDHTNPDSDNDGVQDKNDLRGYVFDNTGSYIFGQVNPDVDSDGLLKEVDPDNDNGGAPDGCEDSNQNGRYEPELGESNNFNNSDDNQGQCIGIQFLGQIGGETQAVATEENLAYVATGPVLSILDVTNPNSVSILGKSDPLPGVLTDVAVSGSNAFVTGESNGLRILDITNPSSPTEVGFYDLPGYAFAIAIDGNLAYIGDENGLTIINVSDPTAPIEIGAIDLPGWSYGVAIAGGYAYVANESGLYVVNVSEPSTPTESGYYNTPDEAAAVAVSGNYVFVADWSSGLRIVDISDPTNPTEIGFFDTFGYASGVDVIGNLVYLTDRSAGVKIIDVTNPALPSEVGSTITPGRAEDISISGNLAAVAAENGGLRILDVGNPNTPYETWSMDTPGDIEQVSIANNYAYAVNRNDLYIIDVTDPSAPVEIGYQFIPGESRGVSLDGNYAYVAGGSGGLRIIDVANPLQTTESGFYDTPGYAWDVVVQNNYAFVADEDAGLRIINVSNPSSPLETGFYDTPGFATGLVIEGNIAFVADGGGGLRIIDVNNPATPNEISFYQTPGYATAVANNNNLAFVADEDFGLIIIDIIDPEQPVEIGSFEMTGGARDVTIAGQLAYVLRINELIVLDVSSPTEPTQVGYYKMPGSTYGVSVTNDRIYVGDGKGGLFILRYSGND